MTPSPNTCEANSGNLACRQAEEFPPSKVIDLEGLIHRCMGNIDLVQRVWEKFQQRLPKDLEELEKALELGDTEQIARVAHRLKGSSASVSAEGIVLAAAEIEEAGRAGRLTDIPVSIERLRDEWNRCLMMSNLSTIGR